MKYLFVLLLALFLMQCGSEPSATSDSSTASAEKVAQPTPQKPVKKEEPKVATRPVTQKAKNTAATFTVAPASTTAKAGSNICVPFEISNFNNIMSMQYSMQWDSKMLQFTRVDGFNLPYMSRQNFGTNKTSQGTLTFLWLNNTLKGNTLTNGSKLYDVCFDVIGKSGQTATLAVTNQPTIIEALDGNEKLVQLNPGKGSVTIE